jgi:aminoglycoside phosphotransferase (APT) family kinase protein
MTVDVPAGSNVEGLDVQAISHWVTSLKLGAQPPLRFQRIGHGQSNLTYLISDDRGRKWVLRRPPLGELLASAHDVVREHRILLALAATDVRAPRALGLCQDGGFTDVPLLLMEYVDGVTLDGPAAVEPLTPTERRAIGLALPAALSDIHAVDLEGTGLISLASHSSYAARQLKRWHRQWERSRTRQLVEIDELHARLRAAVPPQDELRLVHGDFHLANVIVDPTGGSIRAVLDWELCTLGDPLADLGGLLAYWPDADDPQSLSLTVSAMPGFPTRDELVAAYAERTGRSIEALGFWYVLALWKVAIICEGVLRRTLDDPRNAATGSAVTAAMVDGLIRRAMRAAHAEGL